ncbi:hypothetical protein F4560_008608 [Saccharothrix ecbatanensis]|uniref:Zinc finger protein n=1 Tax=Saccharothrix ecbatanensis TaxID=1105145 RepID=A0A7W9M645_9PSEU|nr:zinc finger protein [Saccharothrix ecbatanensis]MBB5808840.1 hypothetical protein [Saccharothrix ecbatanensis]
MPPLRPFRWLPYDRRRHAVNAEARDNETTTTLCDEKLTIPATPATREEWCWPTCSACDAAWRAVEGIPPFPRRPTTTSRTASTAGTRRNAHASVRGNVAVKHRSGTSVEAAMSEV